MARKTEDTMALLGGALIGAAAMYFLDPDEGERRRQRVASAADGKLGCTREMASKHIKSVADRARDLAEHLATSAGGAQHQAADYAHDLADHAHGIASSLTSRAAQYIHDNHEAAVQAGKNWGAKWFDRARDMAGSIPGAAADHAEQLRQAAADQTAGVRRRAANRISRASHTAQSWLGHEEDHGWGTGTLLSSTVGVCAIGVGAMYLFDPQEGRSRRAWISAKVGECMSKTGHMANTIGRDLGQKILGTARDAKAATSNFVSRSRVDSGELVRQIRSRMGHLSDRANLVQLMADADGTVTVTGDIGSDELDRLLSLLHGVPGVSHVINRLNVREDVSPPARPSTQAQR